MPEVFEALKDETVKLLLLLVTTGGPLLVAWIRSKHQQRIAKEAVASLEGSPYEATEALSVLVAKQRVRGSIQPLAMPSNKRLTQLVEKELKIRRSAELEARLDKPD